GLFAAYPELSRVDCERAIPTAQQPVPRSPSCPLYDRRNSLAGCRLPEAMSAVSRGNDLQVGHQTRGAPIQKRSIHLDGAVSISAIRACMCVRHTGLRGSSALAPSFGQTSFPQGPRQRFRYTISNPFHEQQSLRTSCNPPDEE